MGQRIQAVDVGSIAEISERLRQRRQELLSVGRGEIQRRAIEALTHVANSISRIKFPTQIDDIPLYSLGPILDSWTIENLTSLIFSEEVENFEGTGTCLHILATNTPILAWTSVARALLVQSASVVRLPDHPDVISWTLRLMSALRDADPQIAALVELVNWPSSDPEITCAAISESDKVLVFGDDNTIATISELTDEKSKLLTYGNRFSLGILFDDAIELWVAHGFSLDMAIFDQGGCLSPTIIFVLGDLEASTEFAELLASGLNQLKSVFPDRELNSAARIREALDMDRLLTQSKYIVETSLKYSIAVRSVFSLRMLGIPGGVTVVPVRTIDSLISELRDSGLSGKVQGAAIATVSQEKSELAHAMLEGLGVNYICNPGELQRPPFDWKEDGYSVLRSLA